MAEREIARGILERLGLSEPDTTQSAPAGDGAARSDDNEIGKLASEHIADRLPRRLFDEIDRAARSLETCLRDKGGHRLLRILSLAGGVVLMLPHGHRGAQDRPLQQGLEGMRHHNGGGVQHTEPAEKSVARTIRS